MGFGGFVSILEDQLKWKKWAIYFFMFIRNIGRVVKT